MLNKFIWGIALSTVLTLSACDTAQRDDDSQAAQDILDGMSSGFDQYNYHGDGLGTTYNVTIIAKPFTLKDSDIETAINDAMDRGNAHLNNWDPNSEISKFNAAGVEAWQPSYDMNIVINRAFQIHNASDGYFDLAVSSLIDLWGFGDRDASDALPSQAEIDQALALSNMTTQIKVSYDKQQDKWQFQKTNADASLTVSPLAKGYVIDLIALNLNKLGIENYLVEIGGDMRSHGHNRFGKPWQIAIEVPDYFKRDIHHVVQLGNIGMATSGDYRNYREIDGKRYSHIIDPTTGYPITHSTASVTVFAQDAMSADAWATALLAMPQDKAFETAEKEYLNAYFIIRKEDGSFTNHMSSTYENAVEYGAFSYPSE